MKDKIIFLFILILSFSCSLKNNNIRNIEMAWKKSTTNTRRHFASEYSAGQCLTKNIDEEKLSQEILQLENKNISSSKAIINGIDLSQFNASQAFFLEKNMEWIHTKNLVFSDCRDIKCIFSKIYPNSNGLEGYLTYYFFLKMGYMISSENIIPGFAVPAESAFSDTLFSFEEMKYFYILSKSLNEKFHYLPTLSSIHRFPRRYKLPAYPTACGLAGGYTNKGYIILLDECLSNNNNNNWPLSAIAHEVTHRLDYNILSNHSSFSTSPTWLDFSGWYLKETVNTSTGAVSQRDWAIKDDTNETIKNDHFNRDYAATSPIEDFAESVANFRFDAQIIKLKSPRKHEWIEKNLFGKNFTSEGISKNYQSNAYNFLGENISGIINSCVKDAHAFENAKLKMNLTNFQDYDQNLMKCIFGGIEQKTFILIKQLKENELEACDFFEANENIFIENVVSSFSELIKSDLNKNIEIGHKLQFLGDFISSLYDKIDPREVFVQCQTKTEEDDILSCFSQDLSKSFDEVSANYSNEIPEQIIKFKEKYLVENNYIETKNKFLSLFNQIFSGIEIKFSKEAGLVWRKCLEQKITIDDSEEVILKPFNGGTNFISKSILKCVNADSEINLLKLIDNHSKKLGITIESNLKKIILKMYIDKYTSTLQTLADLERTKEELSINLKKDSIKQIIVTSMTNDLSWLSENAINGSASEESCLQLADTRISDEFKNSSNEHLNSFLFHYFQDYSGVWAKEFCQTILSSDKLKTVFKASEEIIFEKSLILLKDILLKNYVPYEIKCKKQYASNFSLIIKARNICLTSSVVWNKIVGETITTWSTMGTNKMDSLQLKRGRDYLILNKSIIQNQAIEDMNLSK